MNYVKLINSFWEVKREREDITVYAQSLYFAVLYYANKNGWKDVSVYREDIIEQAGISKKTYYPARQILKDAGLIDYIEGATNRSKCIFKLIDVFPSLSPGLSTQGDKQGDKPDPKQGDKEGDKPEDHTNKLLNIETNKPSSKEEDNTAPVLKVTKSASEGLDKGLSKSSKKKGKPEADPIPVPNPATYCFYSPAFGELWRDYLDDRKEEASPRTQKTILNKIERYSKGNPELAIEIIEYSIIKKYPSVYEPKPKTNSQPWKQTGPTSKQEKLTLEQNQIKYGVKKSVS